MHTTVHGDDDATEKAMARLLRRCCHNCDNDDATYEATECGDSATVLFRRCLHNCGDDVATILATMMPQMHDATSCVDDDVIVGATDSGDNDATDEGTHRLWRRGHSLWRR